MMIDKLFREHPTDSLIGEHDYGQQPAYANAVSTHVLGELPHDLQRINGGEMSYGQLASKHTAILESSPLPTEPIGRAEAEVRQLDLLFMLGSYLPSGEDALSQAPPSLHEHIDYYAENFGLPSRMTYEMVIDVNTEEYLRTGNIRTFSEGTYALHERDFYVGHYFAEQNIREAAEQFGGFLEAPDSLYGKDQLKDSARNMANFTDFMRSYHKLSKDAFSYMRQFIDMYPDNIRNASGAFMPSVQLLELMLYKPTDGGQHEKYLDEAMPYFPRRSQETLEAQRAKSLDGQNLLDILNGSQLSLEDETSGALKGIVKSFIGFRAAHMSATHKQIPGIFSGNRVPSKQDLVNFGEKSIVEQGQIPGTGGFNAENVMGNALNRLYKLLNYLERTY